jgi:protein gp37
MSDLFHDHVPFEFIHQVFKVIVENPHLTFQILTKRPERMKRYFDSSFPNAFKRTADNPIPHNAWLGVSVENQATANERIPLLVQIPAAVRFLSCEPLLGPVDLYGLNIFHFQGLADYIENGPKPNCAIHWVIVGGESGPRARPMASIWASSLKNQCVSMLIPFFFKQWGEWSPVCSDDFAAPEKYVWVNEFTGENSPTGAKYVASRRVDHPHELMIRIGKKAAGRLLEGKEWNGYPTESNELPIEDVYDDLPF